MSTDLYGIRILGIKPEEKKIKVKVFVVYYDVSYKSHKPLPKDPSFFLEILWDEGNARFGKGGTIGKAISVEQILDRKWLNKNTFKFIKKVELLETANFPLEDYSRHHDFYYERDGGWLNEDKLVQATYEVEVTDERWFEHLTVGMAWSTASYGTKASLQRHADEIFEMLEPAFERVETALKEGEEILSPLFRNDIKIEEAQDILISFFKNQIKEKSFRNWIEELKRHMAAETFSDKARGPVSDLIFFLEEIYFGWIDERMPENLERSNLNLIMSFLESEYKSVSNPLEIEKQSSNSEVGEIQGLTAKYWKEAKMHLEDFEGVADGLVYQLSLDEVEI